MASKIFKLIFLVAIFLLIQGCDDERVTIPPADQDHLPVISVNTVASGGGDIQFPEATPSNCSSPCRNYVSMNADLVFTISAKNPGGVKTLSVKISQDGSVLYNINRSSTPDSQNKVLTALSLLGTDGAGGIGSNPLLVHMRDPKTEVKVEVRAYNFTSSQPSYYTVIFYVREEIENKIGFQIKGENMKMCIEPKKCEFWLCEGVNAEGEKCYRPYMCDSFFILKNISDRPFRAEVYACILFAKNRWAQNNYPNLIQGRNPCDLPGDSDWEGTQVSSGFQMWQPGEEKEVYFASAVPSVVSCSWNWFNLYKCRNKTTAYVTWYIIDDQTGAVHIRKDGWAKNDDFWTTTFYCHHD